MTQTLRTTLAAIGLLALVAPATAQVYYQRSPANPLSLMPYDESLGTSPSFEIYPYADGGPAARVVQRCQYPDGWNVTDFGRDVNGTPNGIDHACPVARVGGRVRAGY